jgi:hypothetical protein
MSRLLTLRADFQTDLDTIRSMYGNGFVLAGKAKSAVLGEKRWRLKERIKACRKQMQFSRLSYIFGYYRLLCASRFAR